MLDWCVEEVKYYVHDFISTRMIPALDGGVIKSDDSVDDSLKVAVQRTADSLRQISKTASKDSNSIITHTVNSLPIPLCIRQDPDTSKWFNRPKGLHINYR